MGVLREFFDLIIQELCSLVCKSVDKIFDIEEDGGKGWKGDRKVGFWGEFDVVIVVFCCYEFECRITIEMGVVWFVGDGEREMVLDGFLKMEWMNLGWIWMDLSV